MNRMLPLAIVLALAGCDAADGQAASDTRVAERAARNGLHAQRAALHREVEVGRAHVGGAGVGAGEAAVHQRPAEAVGWSWESRA